MPVNVPNDLRLGHYLVYRISGPATPGVWIIHVAVNISGGPHYAQLEVLLSLCVDLGTCGGRGNYLIGDIKCQAQNVIAGRGAHVDRH